MHGLKYSITGSKLVISKQNKITQNSRNQYECDFEFSSDWDGLTKFCVFEVENQDPVSIEIIDGKCTIPSTSAQISRFKTSVYGINSTTTCTTNLCNIYIEKTSNFDNSMGSDEPSFFENCLIEMLDIKADIQETIQNFDVISEEIRNSIQENVDIATDIQTTKEEISVIKTEVEADKDEVISAKTTVSQMAQEVEQDKTATQQAMTDFLDMLGVDVATLVGGKIPVSQIPSIATTEIHTVSSQSEQDALSVENGDICIRSDENKSYIYNDGWVYLASPTDYSSTAGYAETAGIAENSTMINNKRIVSMTAEQYASAALNDDTFYFVTEV